MFPAVRQTQRRWRAPRVRCGGLVRGLPTHRSADVSPTLTYLRDTGPPPGPCPSPVRGIHRHHRGRPPSYPCTTQRRFFPATGRRNGSWPCGRTGEEFSPGFQPGTQIRVDPGYTTGRLSSHRPQRSALRDRWRPLALGDQRPVSTTTNRGPRPWWFPPAELSWPKALLSRTRSSWPAPEPSCPRQL